MQNVTQQADCKLLKLEIALEKSQLEGEGPFQSSPGAGKGKHESALILLALVPIAQQQAGAHTRLEAPQCYHANLPVYHCHILQK